MGLRAEDAAATGHAHHDGGAELAGRAEPQSRRFRHQLIVGRIHVVGELDFGDGPQSIRAHVDGDPDDAAFGNRRVEAARWPVLALQTIRAAEDPAEAADVLTEGDDAIVARHHDIHGVADCFDHRERRHVQKPSSWRCSRKCGGISL